MHDYLLKKKVSNFKNQVRSQLFKQGQALERNFNQARTLFSKTPSEENWFSLIYATGELFSYLKVRKSLSPQISHDVAMQKQQAMVNAVLKEISLKEV